MPGRLSANCLLPTAYCLFLSGCGVGAYTEQLEATKGRMKYVDEENQRLGEPLRFSQPPRPIYFRPPKSVRREEGSAAWENLRLVYCPWRDDSVAIPPFEILVAVLGDRGDLDQEVKDFLGRRTGGVAEPANEESFQNQGVPGGPSTISYRRMTMRAEEQITPPRAREPLPERCIYDYDIYLHDEGQVAVIFKQLNLPATTERWKYLEPPSQKPLLGWNEEPNKNIMEDLVKDRQMSLASLIVGPAAQKRLQARQAGGSPVGKSNGE